MRETRSSRWSILTILATLVAVAALVMFAGDDPDAVGPSSVVPVADSTVATDKVGTDAAAPADELPRRETHADETAEARTPPNRPRGLRNGDKVVVTASRARDGSPVEGATVRVFSLSTRNDLPGASIDGATAELVVQADELGRAEFSLPGSVWITGEAEGLYGTLRLSSAAAGNESLRLPMEADSSLTLRTVDQTGRPLGNVPIVLRDPVETSSPAQRRRSERWRGRTGADGSTAIAHFQEVTRDLRPESDDRFIVVEIDRLLRDSPRWSFSRDQVLGGTVTVTLPPGGPVELAVEAPDGTPFEQPTLFWVDDTGRPGEMVTQRLEAPRGRARLPFVPDGLLLRVAAAAVDGSFEPAVVRAPGPTRSGDDTTVTVEFLAAAETVERSRDDAPGEAPLVPIFVARLVDAQGAPLRDRDVRCRVQPTARAARDGGRWTAARTDGAGRLEFQAEPGNPVVNAFAAILEVANEDHDTTVRAEGVVSVRGLTVPGRHEIGDVRLDPPTPIVAGRVLDPDGRPLSRARVSLREEDEPVLHRPVASGRLPVIASTHRRSFHALRHPWDVPVQTITDELGRFRLSSILPAGVLSISVERDHCFPVHDKRIESGETDVAVTMKPCATLEGELRLDPGVPTDAIWIEITAQGRAFVLPIEEDGTFSIGRQRAGLITVRVRSRLDPEPFVTAIVELVAGESRSTPELSPCDLRGKLPLLHVRVVDADGAPASGAVIRFGTHRLTVRPTDDGRVTIIRPRDLASIEVEWDGLPSIRVPLAAEQQEVEVVFGSSR